MEDSTRSVIEVLVSPEHMDTVRATEELARMESGPEIVASIAGFLEHSRAQTYKIMDDHRQYLEAKIVELTERAEFAESQLDVVARRLQALVYSPPGAWQPGAWEYGRE